MDLYDLELLEAARRDPEGELERPTAGLLRLYIFGGEAVRVPELTGHSPERDPDPTLVSWVCRRYFGKDIISYWSWDGIATLVSPSAEASFRLCLDWFDEYYTHYTVPKALLRYEVKDRLVRLLGMARCRPAMIFGNNMSPWSVQAYLRGYRRACTLAGVEANPVLGALIDLGQELATEAGLMVEADVSWARAVGFTRSGFGGEPRDWFPKLLEELERRRGVSVPVVEESNLD